MKIRISMALLLLCPLFLTAQTTTSEKTESVQPTSLTYNQALSEYQKGEYEKSMEMVREILKANGGSYSLHYLAGHNYLKLGNTKGVLNHWYAALELKPGDPNLSADIASYLNTRKMFRESLRVLNVALRNDPENRKLNYEKAVVYCETSQFRSALPLIEKLKAENPNDYKPLVLEAKAYHYLGNQEKAELSLKWALSLVPQKAELHNNLGLIYESQFVYLFRKNRKEDARKYLDMAKESLETAVKIDPSNEGFLQNKERIQTRIDALSDISQNG